MGKEEGGLGGEGAAHDRSAVCPEMQARVVQGRCSRCRPWEARSCQWCPCAHAFPNLALAWVVPAPSGKSAWS